MNGRRLFIFFGVIFFFLLFLIALVPSGGSLKVPIEVVDSAPPSPTSIICAVSPASITLGDSVSVTGSISPAVSNVTVSLTYTKPDGTTIIRSVNSSANGSYSDNVIPDLSGSWKVKASWGGDANYLGATSFDVSFNVQGVSGSGFPMEYVYLTIVVVVIIAVLAAAIVMLKRKK